MRFVMSGINGKYLSDINEAQLKNTERVLAAVAYAKEVSLLFDQCFQRNIPITFYGRLDDDMPVSIPVLEKFLRTTSPNFTCRLVQRHHAKVIWWQGAGLYIGSANLTQSAWYTNVECGCFFTEEEISDQMSLDIINMFHILEENSTPITEELYDLMRERAKIVHKSKPDSSKFWNSSSIRKWSGLVITGKNTINSEAKRKFLEEWYSTLQDIRDIGEKLSKEQNRPAWINPDAPKGAQADQFLHAHYYNRTFSGNKARYEELYQENSSRKAEALEDAITWWRTLVEAPSSEDRMLNEAAPFLRNVLSEDKIQTIDYDVFKDICYEVHSIKDYARRVRNKRVGLPEQAGAFEIPEKVDALARTIWRERTENGYTIVDVLNFVFYGGQQNYLPERLWQAISDGELKIPGVGISALGELVGWALPDTFPPRNGRTSKALRSLGYNVTVHVS